MLITLAFVSGALTSRDCLQEAQRRRSSNARAAFVSAVRDPMLKQATFSPLEFASMIAAEEQCSNAVMPHHISSRIRSEIEQLVAPAAQRLALSRTVGDVGPENIASAVATTLFGSNSPDDAESAEGFFKPMASDPFSMPAASVDQYYDASNTFLDSVLQRRR